MVYSTHSLAAFYNLHLLILPSVVSYSSKYPLQTLILPHNINKDKIKETHCYGTQMLVLINIVKFNIRYALLCGTLDDKLGGYIFKLNNNLNYQIQDSIR